jgi:1-aminocyclopropane-1-carboxylate deaminase
VTVNTTYQSIDYTRAVVQSLHDDVLTNARVQVNILRLDCIHPVVSGNKWFKLQYYLQQAIQEKKKGILTFGGGWSNHLVACAWACRQANLQCIGVVRGEQQALSPALQDAVDYNMQLLFASRTGYRNEAGMIQEMAQSYPDYIIVPQGGQGELGVEGAATILQLTSVNNYSHMVCAAGTGTMLAGLVKSSLPGQQVIGISSLKVDAQHNSITDFVRQQTGRTNFTVSGDYHFGGYARHNDILIQFMNAFYSRHQVPTDFVYTGKLLYGVWDLVAKNYFPHDSRLLVIHSGGLQGNRSIANKLIFPAL